MAGRGRAGWGRAGQGSAYPDFHQLDIRPGVLPRDGHLRLESEDLRLEVGVLVGEEGEALFHAFFLRREELVQPRQLVQLDVFLCDSGWWAWHDVARDRK